MSTAPEHARAAAPAQCDRCQPPTDGTRRSTTPAAGLRRGAGNRRRCLRVKGARCVSCVLALSHAVPHLSRNMLSRRRLPRVHRAPPAPPAGPQTGTPTRATRSAWRAPPAECPVRRTRSNRQKALDVSAAHARTQRVVTRAQCRAGPIPCAAHAPAPAEARRTCSLHRPHPPPGLPA